MYNCYWYCTFVMLGSLDLAWTTAWPLFWLLLSGIVLLKSLNVVYDFQ
jgi:hypothetical protein